MCAEHFCEIASLHRTQTIRKAQTAKVLGARVRAFLDFIVLKAQGWKRI